MSDIPFSSNPLPRAERWGAALLGALLLSLTFFVGSEALWRSYGHRPTVVDDMDLWSGWRARACGAGTNTVVLLGTSRMHVGFCPSAWKEVFPGHRVIQLAIEGKQPLATLEDLANDRSFSGNVICETPEESLFPQCWERQRAYVDYFHQDYSLLKAVERWLRTCVQSRFVAAHPSYDLKQIAGAIIRRRRLPPGYVQVLSDRSARADYALANIGELKATARF